jgi:gliding motility-associated-like protein
MKLSKPSAKCVCLLSLLITGYLSRGQQGMGLPVWPISPLSESGWQVIDWRQNPPVITTFPNTYPPNYALVMPAVNHCGEPVFYVKHSGVRNVPDNLFIFDLEGNALLDNTTTNGPGLNAKQYGYEGIVVLAPGKINEWYILYNKWVSDNGAPLGNGSYVPVNVLYSRVRYRCGTIEVLERDIALKAGSNTYTYSNGIAVSRIETSEAYYLYLVRKNSSDDYISLDRFLIDNNGIQFSKNTGNIQCSFTVLAVDAAPIVVSNDGNRIAVCNRTQEAGEDDIFIFDASLFSNASDAVQAIHLGDLILQPDNNLLFTPMSVMDASNSTPDLGYLKNLERKVVQIAFSPGGQYLYFTHGGFIPGAVYTNCTYLGQIDLGSYSNPKPYPYDVRCQVEIPPGPYDPSEGAGGTWGQYGDQWDATRHIQQCFDGNMYMCKWKSPFLYVVPDPDMMLNNNLVPGIIDNSTPEHPNINVGGSTWWGPNQVDGYNYITSVNPTISLGNDTIICEGDQIALTPGGQFESYCWNDGSFDSVLYAGTTGTYWVEVIDEFGCLAYDTIQVGTTNSIPISLGEDSGVCPGDSLTLSPGSGFQQYLWQDGSTNQEIHVKSPGIYWVEVLQASGCIGRDSVNITLNPFPMVDFGQDTIIVDDETHILDAGAGYDSYIWQDESTGQYYEVTQNGLYWVKVQNEFCEASDSVFVILGDCKASLLIPNCFTPNGDGSNDIFNVTSQNLSYFSLLVFNRWGRLLFETEDLNEGWDGKVNGSLCPVGTYFYLIKFSTLCDLGLEQSGVRKGSVTLLE